MQVILSLLRFADVESPGQKRLRFFVSIGMNVELGEIDTTGGNSQVVRPGLHGFFQGRSPAFQALIEVLRLEGLLRGS